MSKPLVVSIPHRLGKQEARRRLKAGLDGVGANLAICSASRRLSGLTIVFSSA